MWLFYYKHYSRRIAFFDLDNTITDRDTDWLWACWRMRRRLGGLGEVLTLMRLRHHYLRGRLGVDRYVKYHRMRIRGLRPSVYREMSRRFFEESGRHHIFSEALELVDFYRQRGIPVVVITAQNREVAMPFAELIGADDLTARGFNADGDRGTGAVNPYVFREGKVYRAGIHCHERDVFLRECAFFSDSIHDEPLLDQVSQPVAVNPDRLLEARAMESGWPILRLGRP
jgi:HAD superfamily hydrolase (TIGR01490 family)